MSFTSFQIKILFTLGDNKRDKGLTTPEDVARYDNISYGSYGRWNLLDVYRPKNKEGRLPVIISVHGGGWVYGDKDRYQYYCMSLAEQGFAVVNYSYRLAPKYRFPAALEDTNNVAKWVMDNEEKYGMDTKNIFMVGDSAGGHMTALYNCICANPSYASRYDFKVPEGFSVRTVALNCGIYDIEKACEENQSMTIRLMEDLLGREEPEKKLPLISPVNHITEGFPPAFIMTANQDFLKEQPEYLIKKMEQYGIDYQYKLYGDENTPLQHVFHCNMKLKQAHDCNREECEFFLSRMS